MNLRLTRHDFRRDGIFGELVTEEGELVASTLEHAYPGYGPASEWVPKVAVGTYRCVRGIHNTRGRVAKGLPPFETFMLEDVPSFQGSAVDGILIHPGNRDDDSEGCLILGHIVKSNSGVWLLANSRETFKDFMDMQDGLSSFLLLIV